MHVDAKEPCAGMAGCAMNEDPDECAEQECRCLRETANLGPCPDSRYKDIDQRRSHCRRIGEA
jgi:hypothetical protein